MIEQILQRATGNKAFQDFEMTMYVILVEWGWSYKEFQETPIPVIMMLLKQHAKINKAKKKKNGK